MVNGSDNVSVSLFLSLFFPKGCRMGIYPTFDDVLKVSRVGL